MAALEGQCARQDVSQETSCASMSDQLWMQGYRRRLRKRMFKLTRLDALALSSVARLKAGRTKFPSSNNQGKKTTTKTEDQNKQWRFEARTDWLNISKQAEPCSSGTSVVGSTASSCLFAGLQSLHDSGWLDKSQTAVCRLPPPLLTVLIQKYKQNPFTKSHKMLLLLYRRCGRRRFFAWRSVDHMTLRPLMLPWALSAVCWCMRRQRKVWKKRNRQQMSPRQGVRLTPANQSRWFITPRLVCLSADLPACLPACLSVWLLTQTGCT